MRIALIVSTLIFLSLSYPASALPEFLNGWPSSSALPEFLNNWPSYDFGQLQVAFPFSPPFGTQSGFDFWRSAKDLGDKAVQYTNKALQDAATQYTAAAEKIDEFKVSMNDVVSKTQAMRHDIHDALEARGLNLDDISEMFSTQLASVLEDLKAEFSEPLPEEQTARYKRRAAMVARGLDMIEDEFVKLSSVWGMSEVDARKSYGVVKRELNHVLLIAGQLIDNHPGLLKIIIIFVVFTLVPESWFLRPLLRVFGFGPMGPVKGSAAAWAQGQLWGGFVKEGSWFAILQSAGMKMTAW